MNYNDIKTWLTDTVRNEHFFQQESNDVQLEKDRIGFREAYKTLRESLEIHEIRGDLTREAYLEWVKLWKATYAKLSYESRMAKRHRKSTEDGAYLAGINQVTVLHLRWCASLLLRLRVLSKEAANRAWLKEKEKATELA